MPYDLDDNILAISTPSGRSHRAIIRLSGKKVFNHLRNFFAPGDCEGIVREKGFSSYQGSIYIEKERIKIPVCVYFMKAPNSYTRDDVLEIHTFSSPPLLEMLMEKLLFPERNDRGEVDYEEEKASLRLAVPGEFTKRAFLNGRISLTEAESVMRIIRSQTDSELLLAVSNLKGKLGVLMEKTQKELINLCARIEAAIDFCDQDIELISLGEVGGLFKQIKEKLSKVVEEDQRARVFNNGIKTVIIGWPNVGKSSLFNSLLNYSKAIVTPISGTTRDTLEAVLNLEGINFRIIDTAGIVFREGELESVILKRTYGSIEDAQIVLFVVDGSVEYREEQMNFFSSITTENKIIVISKKDLSQEIDYGAFLLKAREGGVVKISSVTEEGLVELKKIMVSSVLKNPIDISASSMVFTMRQKIILFRALEILERTINLLDQGTSHELVAVELRSLIDVIGEVSGDVLTDDILEIIFSDFCVGK